MCVSVSVYLVEPSPRQIDPLAFKREKGSEWIEQLPVVVVVLLPLLYRTVRILSVVLRTTGGSTQHYPAPSHRRRRIRPLRTGVSS